MMKRRRLWTAALLILLLLSGYLLLLLAEARRELGTVRRSADRLYTALMLDWHTLDALVDFAVANRDAFTVILRNEPDDGSLIDTYEECYLTLDSAGNLQPLEPYVDAGGELTPANSDPVGMFSILITIGKDMPDRYFRMTIVDHRYGIFYSIDQNIVTGIWMMPYDPQYRARGGNPIANYAQTWLPADGYAHEYFFYRGTPVGDETEAEFQARMQDNRNDVTSNTMILYDAYDNFARVRALYEAGDWAGVEAQGLGVVHVTPGGTVLIF